MLLSLIIINLHGASIDIWTQKCPLYEYILIIASEGQKEAESSVSLVSGKNEV